MKMLLDTIILPFRIFQFFMLSPLGLTDKTKIPVNKVFMRNISIAIIVTNFTVFLNGMFVSDTYIDWSQPAISCYLDLFCMLLVRTTVLVILVQSLIKRNVQIRFFDGIQKVDKILTEKLSACMEHQRRMKLNNNRTALWHIMYISNEVTQLMCWIISGDKYALVFWAFAVLPSYIITLRLLQMTVFVNLIRYRFEIVNRLIRSLYTTGMATDKVNNSLINDLSAGTKSSSKKCDQQNAEVEKYLICEKLIHLRQTYVLLYEATKNVNELFGWSVQISLANAIVNMLICIYWIFLWILGPSLTTLYITVAAISATVTHMFHIVSISHDCHYTAEEVG